MFIYQVVGEQSETFRDISELTSRYPQSGTAEHPRLRQELQGQPQLAGLLGPMYNGIKDGKTVIRYETRAAYDMLCQ